jgi:hypothetical protein
VGAGSMGDVPSVARDVVRIRGPALPCRTRANADYRQCRWEPRAWWGLSLFACPKEVVSPAVGGSSVDDDFSAAAAIYRASGLVPRP